MTKPVQTHCWPHRRARCQRSLLGIRLIGCQSLNTSSLPCGGRSALQVSNTDGSDMFGKPYQSSQGFVLVGLHASSSYFSAMYPLSASIRPRDAHSGIATNSLSYQLVSKLPRHLPHLAHSHSNDHFPHASANSAALQTTSVHAASQKD